MKTILLMMDSLNRHHLNCYGADWIRTPNLDRLAERGVVFDNHFAGSLPCMPARREFMTGRLNFLESPWGPIEPWDVCLPEELRRQRGTYSHMITDHYHYFHSGGEAYHTLFDSWEFQRGQEGDLWRPWAKEVPIPEFKGKNRRSYWVNRMFMDTERDEDYPTPQCFSRAIDFLENHHDADNWHLHLEVFDPHEPFACPQRYLDEYGDAWGGSYHFDWPSYKKVTEGPEAVAHIRNRYAAVLTMADRWLGKLLDKMDEWDAWKDTALLCTTDHGYLLGERGYWAKNYMFSYNELAAIPLIVCAPEGSFSKRRVSALTATMDIMPTILELHGAEAPGQVHGRSLLPLLDRAEKHHEAVLFGYFGKDINLCDGRYTYCRQPLEGSVVHHHTAMPRSFSGFIDAEKLREAETGIFLRHCQGIPHYRIAEKSKRHADAPDFHPMYDLAADPAQSAPIRDAAIESALVEAMIRELDRVDAPECQYTRMGLTKR